MLRLAVLVLLPALGFCAAETSHFDFRREAEAAYAREDYPAALKATAEALRLRPDSPRYHYNLAALSVLTGDRKAAYQHLHAIAELGVVMPVQRDPDFAPLQGEPEFLRVLRAFAANAEPRGSAEVVAELPGRTGIIEGIAFRPRTGDLFLSDVHHRCVWRRDGEGRVTRFTEEDEELFGVFGLAVDEARNALWAATTALPEIAGYEKRMKGLAGLAEFDLATGALRRVLPAPVDGPEHGLGDVTLAADGTLYVSDSKAPVIWQLAPGGEDLEKLVESKAFESLQGMVVLERTLLVADYVNGLFAIDLATRNVTPLAPPPNTTLLGLDGLVAIADGIVATQNGVEPQRVVQIRLNRELNQIMAVTVLASGHAYLSDVTLLTVVNQRPTWVAGAGWDGFDPTKARQPPAHAVRIFQTSLPD